MVLMDNFLVEIAKFVNGESAASSPTHVAWSTDTSIPAADDTALVSELDRSAVTATRNSATITLTGQRSGGIASPGGDYLNLAGLFTADTAGTLLSQAQIPNVLHTNAFDMEVEWVISIERKG